MFESSRSSTSDESIQPEYVPTPGTIGLARRLYLFQLRALLYKNLTLVSRQMGTLICHILTPISMLLALKLLIVNLMVVMDMNKTEFQKRPLFPLVHNLPSNLINNASVFPISYDSCVKWFGYEVAREDYEGNDIVKGILNDPLREYCPGSNKLTPYFQKFSVGSSFNQYVQGEIDKKSQNTMRPGRDVEDVEAFPDGNIYFKSISPKRVDIKMQVNDMIIAEYHINNGVTKSAFKLSDSMKTRREDIKPLTKDLKNQNATWPSVMVTEGYLTLMDILTRNILHSLNPKVYLISAYSYLISFDVNEKFLESIYYIVGSGIFPMAMGLTLPIFMHLTVTERHTKVKSIMQMHGLKEVNYWLVNIFTSFLQYLMIYFGFYFSGRYLFDMKVFISTSPELMHCLNFFWGLNQIGLAIILQLFVTSPRTANIVGYTGSVTVQFFCIYIAMQMYNNPFKIPFMLLFIPQMSFSRMYFFISQRCMEVKCYQGLDELKGEAATAFYMFLLTGILYPTLGVLISYMQFQGIGLLPHWYSKKRAVAIEPYDGDRESAISSGEGKFKDDIEEETAKVAKIRQNQEFLTYPVVISGVSKTYTKAGRSFQALKPTYISIKKGQVLGLLGPNGAGKTTLLSILTGATKPDSGEAWIGGSNIRTELPNVYKSIGVCPQFDLFWEDLTIQEHLLFYLRLKGAHREDELLQVDKVCQEVELSEHRDKLAKELSGGMKRRLSLAVALIGNPDAIFLDEPTTGLDPLNREIFWGILERIKTNRCIILTTHLMQEADFLSDRISIIHEGQLLCIGTSSEVKKRHGPGLILNLIFEKEGGLTEADKKESMEGMKEMLTYLCDDKKVEKFALLSEAPHTARFGLTIPDEHILEFFEFLETNKAQLNIGHFELSFSPLKEVFQSLVA